MYRILLASAAAICINLSTAHLNPASAQYGYVGGHAHSHCQPSPRYSASYGYRSGYSPYGRAYSYGQPGLSITRSSYYSGFGSPIYGPVPGYRYGSYGTYGYGARGNVGYGPPSPFIVRPGIQLRIGF